MRKLLAAAAAMILVGSFALGAHGYHRPIPPSRTGICRTLESPMHHHGHIHHAMSTFG